MTPKYTITTARPRDLTRLAAIELAAARLLAGHAPESVLGETTSLNVLNEALREGHLWVALADDAPVGFAHVELIERGAVHLEEIDVHPDHGRRGLGARLVLQVCDWAAGHGYGSITLTTFRDVPWNMPFYKRLGFDIVPPEQVSATLRAIVEDETRRGLDRSRRVVMKRPISCPRASAHCEGSRARMNTKVTLCRDDGECEELGSFLADRIYEFNAKATGYFDGMLLAGCIRNDAGDIIAGFNGHTWGGCCELSHVWVDERYRGQGLGAVLLRSAEAQAVARRCAQVVLATHSFQAPGFYERMGYEKKYAIEGRPKGYADIIYVKILGPSDSSRA